MTGDSELRLTRIARRESARPMRHAVAAFLAACSVAADAREDILTAIGEALANAVEHAYGDEPLDEIELYARLGRDDTLTVDVFDHGTFIERDPRPGRGFGLRIVEAIAKAFTIETGNGTRIHMVFNAPRTPDENSGDERGEVRM